MRDRRSSPQHGGSATWSSTGTMRRSAAFGNPWQRGSRSSGTTTSASVCRIAILVGAEPTLDGQVATLSDHLDELALERVSLIGGSTGGCTAVAFAARFPDRVEQLLLYGAYMDGTSIASRDVREAIIAAVRSHWGLGSRLLADIFLGEVGSADQSRLRAGINGPRRTLIPRRPCCSFRLWERRELRRSSCVQERSSHTAAGIARSLPARQGASRRDPRRNAGSARRRRPFSVGRRFARRGTRSSDGARSRNYALEGGSR